MEYTDGNCKYKVKKIATGSGVLSGTILAFSGNFSDGYPIDKTTGNADTTWHICDGTNGTPDLRGRFILGASASHATGTTGGEEAHSLTPDENAPHGHDATCSQAGLHHHDVEVKHGSRSGESIAKGYTGSDKSTFTTTDAGLHAHTITIGVSGSGAPHNNMPPYYTLSYIMKL